MKIVIRPPGKPCYTVSIELLTDLVTVWRELYMGALQEKMAMARKVAGNLRTKMIADADKLIEKGTELDKLRSAVFDDHNFELDQSMEELKALERELAQFSNEPRPTRDTDAGSPPTNAWSK